MFYSSYEPKFIKHMVTDYDVCCLRNNVLAVLYHRIYAASFQGNFANSNT